MNVEAAKKESLEKRYPILVRPTGPENRNNRSPGLRQSSSRGEIGAHDISRPELIWTVGYEEKGDISKIEKRERIPRQDQGAKRRIGVFQPRSSETWQPPNKKASCFLSDLLLKRAPPKK